jgi:hypothetical protein
MNESPADILHPIFSQAVLFATGQLQAERVLIVYEGMGLVCGLEASTLWLSGEISTSLLQALIEEGEPQVLVDAVEDVRTRDQTSAILSALRSALYIPLKNPTMSWAGLLYIDHRGRAGVFAQEQLMKAQRFVDETLTPQLHEAFPNACGDHLDWDSLVHTEFI